MDVITNLYNLLNALGYPVFLQGTYTGATYPESFITYTVNSTDDINHYDDDVASWGWDISVIFYTKVASLMDTAPDAIRAQLKKAGFIPQGKGYNIFSDDPDFTGWITEFLYQEQNK